MDRVPDFLPERITRYELEALAHRGALSMVVRARDVDLDRPVALKILAPELAQDIEARNRFLAEAKATARVRHANIIEVYDVGEQDGLPFMVVAWIDGVPLGKLVGGADPLPIRRIIALLSQLAGALDHAHAHGLVHRDIKPGNVLVDMQDHVTLTDFGLARVADRRRITHVGTQLGTPAYMSPEQVRGETAGPAADRYGFAVLAFELLTGRLPFDHADPFAMMSAHVNTPPPLASATRADLPKAVDRVMRQGLAKDPAARPSTAAAFVAQLSNALADRVDDIGWLARARRLLTTPIRALSTALRVGVARLWRVPTGATRRIADVVHVRPRPPLLGALVASMVLIGATYLVAQGRAFRSPTLTSGGGLFGAGATDTAPPMVTKARASVSRPGALAVATDTPVAQESTDPRGTKSLNTSVPPTLLPQVSHHTPQPTAQPSAQPTPQPTTQPTMLPATETKPEERPTKIPPPMETSPPNPIAKPPPPTEKPPDPPARSTDKERPPRTETDEPGPPKDP